MKKILSSIAIAALLAATIQAQEAASLQPLTVAVLAFDGAAPSLQGKAVEAATLLGAQLSTNADIWCVERAEVEKILSEQTLKLTGLTDPANAVQAGRIIGARVLVTGRVLASGNGALLVAKIMSTETSRVFGETASAPDLTSLEKPTAELAEKIGKLLAKQQAAFRVPVETAEARITRLRKLVQGKTLPSVMVSIPEQHLRQSVPDPAVETEMKNTLLALGFEVIDATQSAKKPDITIKGEAFSEAGARRGQLISARARIEAQAIRQNDAKVLAVDRETGVAVDIVESVAGKSALQNSASLLIERLLPKLVAP